MNSTTIRMGLVVFALLGCKDKEPEMPKVSQVFPFLPLPPEASVVSKRGSTDALQLTLRSPAKVAMVESFYRTTLSTGRWKLANDMRDRDGSLVLLAEQDGPPLWVRIKSTDDSTGTMVELNGAVMPNSATPEKPAS